MGQKLQERIQFDSRLVKRNLERGRLDQDKWNKHLQTLPDVSDKGEAVFPDSGDASPGSGKGSRKR